MKWKLPGKLTVIIAAGLIVILALSYFFLAPWLAQTIAVRPAATAYSSESRALVSALASVGLPVGETAHQCFADSFTERKEITCQAFNTAGYQAGTIPFTFLAEHTKQARVLDEVLTRNGWKPDRPHDMAHTVAALYGVNMDEFGAGMDLPLSKKVGEVRCNLDISAQADPGFTAEAIHLYINEFSCAQTKDSALLYWFMPPGGGV